MRFEWDDKKNQANIRTHGLDFHMNAKKSKKPSKTDWEKVDAFEDEMIDASEIPELDEAFFADAQLRVPAKRIPVTLRIDADVLKWFKTQDKEYEDLINAALRIYAHAHKASSC